LSVPAFPLSYLATAEAAEALISGGKTAADQITHPDEQPVPLRSFFLFTIARLRNPLLLPRLDMELAVATDESLKADLKFAIVANREGLPAGPTEEVLKTTWKKVAG
jgi:hypothetical protein